MNLSSRRGIILILVLAGCATNKAPTSESQRAEVAQTDAARTALPEATAEDRVQRVYAAARLGNTAEVITGLTALVRQNPDRLNDSIGPFIVGVLSDAKKKLPHGSSLPLLQALYGAGWKLKWNQEPSFAWHDLALLLLEQNRLSAAIEVSKCQSSHQPWATVL